MLMNFDATTVNPYVTDEANVASVQPANQIPIESGFGFPTLESKNADKEVEITTLEDINIENIDWLWKHWLARRKLSIYAGPGGVGKSTLTLKLAATVSNGGYWPDGTRCPQGYVLIWTGEDGISDTLAPRLLAMGANPKMVGVVTGTRDKDGNKIPFNPATDMPRLQATLRANSNVALVIIDPIVSAVDGDMNQTNVVRKSLDPCVQFAEENNCNVLGITHFRKGSQGTDPLERVIGSTAFKDVARTVMVSVKNKESTKRVFALAKGNVGGDTGGFEYHIETAYVNGNIETSTLEFGVRLSGSAYDIVNSVESDGEDTKQKPRFLSKQEEAEQFLMKTLADGVTVKTSELKKMATFEGIAMGTLNRAIKALNVVSGPTSYQGEWGYRLPKIEDEISH